MTTEQQKLDRLAEFMGFKSLNLLALPSKTKKEYNPYEDFNPYNDWNHAHMVLDKIMEDEELAYYLLSMVVRDINVIIFKATKQELMDAVYNLLTNS